MSGRFLQVKAYKLNELVAVDYYGPLPRSIGGAEYIFVVVDVFSRFVQLFKATISYMRNYFETAGKRERVLSDHGTQFMSQAWCRFMSDENVRINYCSIRHPEGNPSDRIMRELNKFFRIYCNDQHTAWTKYVSQVSHWFNYTTNSTTGYTPYKLHFGRSPVEKIRQLIKFLVERSEPHEIKIQLANQWTDRLHKRQKERRASYGSVPIEVGDLLRILKQSNMAERKITKFFHLYYGPYRIHRNFNENAFELVDKNDPKNLIGRFNRSDFRILVSATWIKMKTNLYR